MDTGNVSTGSLTANTDNNLVEDTGANGAPVDEFWISFVSGSGPWQVVTFSDVT